MISGEDDSLTGLWFEGQKFFAQTLRKDAEENNGKMLIVLKIRMKRYDTIESMTSILKNFEKVELVQIA